MKKTLTGPNGLMVDLDTAEVFPDDPGNGTPAIVRGTVGPQRGATATFGCACGTGMLWSHREGDVPLTPRQQDWLESPVVDAAMTTFFGGPL